MARSKTKPKPGKGILETAKNVGRSVANKVTGRSAKPGKGKGKKRNRGPQYWANKVIVAKLKKKYYKLRYAGV